MTTAIELGLCLDQGKRVLEASPPPQSCPHSRHETDEGPGAAGFILNRLSRINCPHTCSAIIRLVPPERSSMGTASLVTPELTSPGNKLKETPAGSRYTQNDIAPVHQFPADAPPTPTPGPPLCIYLSW